MLKNLLYFFAGTGLATLILAPKLHAQMKLTSQSIRKRLIELQNMVKSQEVPVISSRRI